MYNIFYCKLQWYWCCSRESPTACKAFKAFTARTPSAFEKIGQTKSYRNERWWLKSQQQ